MEKPHGFLIIGLSYTLLQALLWPVAGAINKTANFSL
jgi:hypothetical protein